MGETMMGPEQGPMKLSEGLTGETNEKLNRFVENNDRLVKLAFGLENNRLPNNQELKQVDRRGFIDNVIDSGPGSNLNEKLFETKLKNIFTKNKFGNNIDILSKFIEKPAFLINEWFSNNDVSAISIFGLKYEPKIYIENENDKKIKNLKKTFIEGVKKIKLERGKKKLKELLKNRLEIKETLKQFTNMDDLLEYIIFNHFY